MLFCGAYSNGMRKFILSVLIVGLILLVSCAKRGNITGGLKDTLAPVLKSSTPKNGATQFNGKEIKLYFDEYVKLKNVSKQLIVSPPMKNKPEVLPYSASKYITIKLKDTLQPNTTYSFNFGQSIEDNNESNILNQFKYVFSTGDYIDSLTLGVKIKDALELKSPTFVSVMLYEINEKYNDSTIYKDLPRYITNSLDGLSAAKLENLKPGQYRLIALKDNGNNKFDPKSDKIGYINDFVTVPNDTLFELELFQEIPAFKTFKPSQVSGNRLIVGYEGNAKDAEIDVKKNGGFVPFTVTKFPKKDSLQIWLPPMKNDSLKISITNKKYNQEYTVKIKDQKRDTLAFSNASGSDLAFRKKFTIHADLPIVSIDRSKIRLINKDSLPLPFQCNYDEINQDLVFDFEKQPQEKYKITALPGAFTDFYEKKNDTLQFTFSTRNTSDYGNLRVPLERIARYPIIVQITDDKGVVIESEYLNSGNRVNFDLIEPKKYTLRVVYDDNKNGVWDPGNYMEKRQSEQVIYFPKELDVRANWDVEQPFDLGSTK